jgi:hypothetical protein
MSDYYAYSIAESTRGEFVTPKFRTIISISKLTMSEKLTKEISHLSPEDAYIFQFYYTELKQNTINLLPDSVGSLSHLRFLQQESKNNPRLGNIHKFLQYLKRPTFHHKAKRMVELGKRCAELGKWKRSKKNKRIM